MYSTTLVVYRPDGRLGHVAMMMSIVKVPDHFHHMYNHSHWYLLKYSFYFLDDPVASVNLLDSDDVYPYVVVVVFPFQYIYYYYSSLYDSVDVSSLVIYWMMMTTQSMILIMLYLLPYHHQHTAAAAAVAFVCHSYYDRFLSSS